MTTMGFYEARTRLSELLDHVTKGKKVLITRHGKPAALIGPPPKQDRRDVHQVVQEMLAFRDREGPALGGPVTMRELIDEGRLLRPGRAGVCPVTHRSRLVAHSLPTRLESQSLLPSEAPGYNPR